MIRTVFNKKLHPLLNNLFWFGISLVLAFMVWFVATIQADPITSRVFRSMDVRLILPENLVLANTPTQLATVTLTAQQSLLDSLTREDVIVRAILEEGVPDDYDLALIVSVAGTESFSAQTQPRQINVELEQIVSQQQSPIVTVNNPPAVDFAYDEPIADILQVQVSGASSRVADVAEVRGAVDLSEARTNFSGEISLLAYDAQGRRIRDVTIEPPATFVTVDVYQRDDVRRVAIIPDIQASTLPVGYVVTDVSVNPTLIYISGAPETLAELERDENINISTETIALSEREEDFEVTVALVFPDGVLPFEGERSVTVNVGISAMTVARQFDNIAVETVGLPANYRQNISPSTVSVVLNGPIDIIDNLESDDIQIVLNLAGVEPGNIELSPDINIRQGEIVLENPQFIPPVLNVSIIAVTPENTAQPDATPVATRTP